MYGAGTYSTMPNTGTYSTMYGTGTYSTMYGTGTYSTINHTGTYVTMYKLRELYNNTICLKKNKYAQRNCTHIYNTVQRHNYTK